MTILDDIPVQPHLYDLGNRGSGFAFPVDSTTLDVGTNGRAGHRIVFALDDNPGHRAITVSPFLLNYHNYLLLLALRLTRFYINEAHHT